MLKNKKEIKTMAYNYLVRSHFEYASAAWSPNTKEKISKIEKSPKKGSEMDIKRIFHIRGAIQKFVDILNIIFIYYQM